MSFLLSLFPSAALAFITPVLPGWVISSIEFSQVNEGTASFRLEAYTSSMLWQPDPLKNITCERSWRPPIRPSDWHACAKTNEMRWRLKGNSTNQLEILFMNAALDETKNPPQFFINTLISDLTIPHDVKPEDEFSVTYPGQELYLKPLQASEYVILAVKSAYGPEPKPCLTFFEVRVINPNAEEYSYISCAARSSDCDYRRIPQAKGKPRGSTHTTRIDIEPLANATNTSGIDSCKLRVHHRIPTVLDQDLRFRETLGPDGIGAGLETPGSSS